MHAYCSNIFCARHPLHAQVGTTRDFHSATAQAEHRRSVECFAYPEMPDVQEIVEFDARHSSRIVPPSVEVQDGFAAVRVRDEYIACANEDTRVCGCGVVGEQRRRCEGCGADELCESCFYDHRCDPG